MSIESLCGSVGVWGGIAKKHLVFLDFMQAACSKLISSCPGDGFGDPWTGFGKGPKQ